mgnify:FL=1
MNMLTIGLYFIDILAGLFSGLYVGFSFRYRTLTSQKRKKSKKREKQNIRRKGKEKKVISHESSHNLNLLSNRVPETESYTSFVCDSMGENSVEHIEKIRKSQDQKYLSKTKK